MISYGCLKCGRFLVDGLEGGMIRIRARVILLKLSTEEMHAVCPQCKEVVKLPFIIRKDEQHVENDTFCFIE